MRVEAILLAAALAAVLPCGRPANAGGDTDTDTPPKFKITTRRADDSVQVQADGTRTVFSVKSPFGISHAVIERLDERWPQAVVLKLHLKGLSSLRVSGGKARVDAAVSGAEVRQWRDGKEEDRLDEKAPLWLPIRILDDAGKPAREIPLANGYFEVTLPPALFEGNPRTITVGWIDFYR